MTKIHNHIRNVTDRHIPASFDGFTSTSARQYVKERTNTKQKNLPKNEKSKKQKK